MQIITVPENTVTYSSATALNDTIKVSGSTTDNSPMIYGLRKSIIKTGIWINIMLLGLVHFKNPVIAFKAVKNLKKLRNDLRDKHSILKYAKTNGKYYFTFNAPGWPSQSFNRYVLNNIKKLDASKNTVTLDTILFGITKKCGYQCEHCFEWDALNKPETLSRENLLSVIHSFQNTGITQVQLSGGEPLNRFDDIIYILQNIKSGTEVWLYTSGYHFTKERAAALKQNGLTGITVSLDHWIPELHNIFRGKENAFDWAQKAVVNARAEGLVVCLSLCATKDFITQKNLVQYAELAKQWGVSFIQVLEPKAVGHYNGKDVCLSEDQIALLEDFYTTYNYDKAWREYPAVVYHGFYSRRVSCGGGGKHYVYVDTDGDVHNCPFCQRKIFSALHDDIKDNLRLMAAGGCNAFVNQSQKKTAV
ncbi:MAG: radical SAM protein [Bacteroidota bacterium]|nr:radical SAM protein [Bacteroidota bacterium]